VLRAQNPAAAPCILPKVFETSSRSCLRNNPSRVLESKRQTSEVVEELGGADESSICPDLRSARHSSAAAGERCPSNGLGRSAGGGGWRRGAVRSFQCSNDCFSAQITMGNQWVHPTAAAARFRERPRRNRAKRLSLGRFPKLHPGQPRTAPRLAFAPTSTTSIGTTPPDRRRGLTTF